MPRAMPHLSVCGVLLLAPDMPLPNGNHATHARHCRGLSERQMRAREGGCNAGLGSSNPFPVDSGKDAFFTSVWGVGGASPSPPLGSRERLRVLHESIEGVGCNLQGCKG